MGEIKQTKGRGRKPHTRKGRGRWVDGEFTLGVGGEYEEY